MYPELKLYIAGQWLSADALATPSKPVHNPATGAVLGHLPTASLAQLDAAARSAVRGFDAWRGMTAHARCVILQKAASLMRAQAASWAQVLTAEQGKPLAEALREITLSADILDFQAEEGKRLYGRTIAPRVAGILSQTVVRQPIGPVLALTPWNFPVNLPTRKLASALAAGCSVVLKPDEHTPASAQILVQILLDAGVPPEALQLVHGVPQQVSSTLIAHPAMSKVSFTGSVAVGQLLGEQCARHSKRFTGELGGFASVIVCADMHQPADIAQVVKLSVAAKFRNAGQVCASPIRFLVHRSFYDTWLAAFVNATQQLVMGNGNEQSTQVGPLSHAGRLPALQSLVDDALAQGAQLHCGGQRANAAHLQQGLFYQPTVLSQVPAHCKVAHEEPFGPIALVQAFDHLDQAIDIANSLPYGLASYAFTRDLLTAHTLGEKLQAGMVGINHFGVSQPEAPFGGWKSSGGTGGGQEMGAEGILPYTEVKLVSVAAI